jgi:Heparinase II/III-like protein/Heparinase II/III N-terminus
VKPGPSNATRIWLALLCCLLLPVLILGWIWIPEFQHFYARNERIEDRILEQSRQAPSDAVLRELRSYRLLWVNFKNDSELIDVAEKLLQGSAEIPGYAPVHIVVPFSPGDLEKGGGMWRLQFSGLLLPQILLDAYQLTGREEFWNAARDSILAWGSYDRTAWINKGALWDDHALVLKLQTLADFWSLYRGRSDYDPNVARFILEFVARTGERLTNRASFNFASNHGMMSNIGLWHLCITFPFLPRVEKYKQIALARITEQMGYYISNEGVVLEHSAGYDELGLRLLGMAFRYATLLHLHVPADWIAKYKALKGFYEEIQRPDGTLPRLGDTLSGKAIAQFSQLDSEGRASPLVRIQPREPPSAFQIYPISGYAVAWNGIRNWPVEQDLSQTVLTWSYYEGHPHKHADELSVIFWDGGLEWWTNVGYWSYDDPDYAHAACWEGSNAPHLVSEPCQSRRQSSLLNTFQGKDLWAIEAERKGPGALVVRRQVVYLAPRLWIIVDQASGGSQSDLRTIWTTQPDVSIDFQSPAEGFRLSSTNGRRMRAWILGPPGMSTKVFHGSREPFAGWISLNGDPKATEAVLTEQRADKAWAVMLWDLEPYQSAVSARPKILQWGDADHWRISLPFLGEGSGISRSGDVLNCIRAARAESEVANLLPAADVSAEVAELRGNFEAVAAKYPRFRELHHYRVKVSYITLFASILETIFLLLYRSKKKFGMLGWAAVLFWLAWWGWLRFFYFST